MRKIYLLFPILMAGYSAAGQDGGIDFENTQENYILTPDHAALDFSNNFTMECWIQPRLILDAMMLLQKGTCDDYTFGFSLQIRPDSTVMFGVNTNTGSCSSNDAWQTTTKLIPGECVHLAVTYGSPGPVIYFDGVAQPGVYYSGSFGGNINTSDKPLQTGIYTNYSGDQVLGFDGKMDELRIWSVVRTPAEIVSGTWAPLDGNEPGLQLYYNFNSFVAGDNAIIANNAITGAALNGTVSSLNTVTPAPGSGACFASVSADHNELSFLVYPNPSEGAVFFELTDASGVYDDLLLTVVSSDGRIIAAEKITGTIHMLDGSGFARGVYHYTIAGSNSGIVSSGTLLFD